MLVRRFYQASAGSAVTLDQEEILASNLAYEISLFDVAEDSNLFIEWCRVNPGGFVWNCRRSKDTIVPWMLHAAIHNEKLCEHFRNGARPSGYEDNLTTEPNCKVCSVDRRSLLRWAQSVQPGSTTKECSDCMSGHKVGNALRQGVPQEPKLAKTVP
jgi:hypothetical protein